MTTTKPTEAEFDELKRKSDKAIQKIIAETCARHGWDPRTVLVHVSGAGDCYCNCPEGPCQHEWGGWREFEDGNGGEQICTRCGTGIMNHCMRFE